MSAKTHSKRQGATSEVSGVTGITLRTYITAFVVLIGLMVAALVLTWILPAGEFDRVTVDGAEVIVTGSYHSVTGDLPLWKWLLSPLLILGGPNSVTLIMLLVFLFVIGGAFYALESCGVLAYLIARVAKRFEHNNRLLLFVLPLVFMLLGSLIGSFEETIPLAALVVALALRLGWDRIQGLGMSLLAVGCGFAVGVMNPFTVGIAQSIAGLPTFSGAELRIISFVVVYAYLMAFLLFNARRSERRAAVRATAADSGRGEDTLTAVLHEPSDTISPASTKTNNETQSNTEALTAAAVPASNPHMQRALRVFMIVFLLGIVAIIACSALPVPGLVDLVFPVCALTFLLCGIIAPLLSGCGSRQLGVWFAKGIAAIAPSALLVLMASSISYMLTEGRVLDTIIFSASEFLMDKPVWVALLGIYLLVLLLEFAVPSGSAKAFLLIPLIAPLVDMIGISRQLSVLAYAFGDGFSNVAYPTNPALLIALSISGVSYGRWLRRTWPFFAGLLLITSLILIVSLIMGYR